MGVGRASDPTAERGGRPRDVNVREVLNVDKGYLGRNHPHKFRVWISG